MSHQLLFMYHESTNLRVHDIPHTILVFHTLHHPSSLSGVRHRVWECLNSVVGQSDRDASSDPFKGLK